MTNEFLIDEYMSSAYITRNTNRFLKRYNGHKNEWAFLYSMSVIDNNELDLKMIKARIHELNSL